MRRPARAVDLVTAVLRIGVESVTVVQDAIVQFTRRGFQGFFVGRVLSLYRLKSGAISLWLLITHWHDSSWLRPIGGCKAVYVGARAILKVLPTTEGKTP